MAAPRQGCMWRGCGGWAFERGLCRCHLREPATAGFAFPEALWRQYTVAAAQAVLVATAATPSDLHLLLAEGDRAELLAMCSDGLSCIVRSKGRVGYYDRRYLATEQEVYEAWKAESAGRQVQAAADQKAAEKRQEEEYELQMRLKMKLKIEQDKEKHRRQAEEQRARAEAARLALEEERQLEELQQQARAAQRRQAEAEAGRQLAEHRAREAARAHQQRAAEDEAASAERVRREQERVAYAGEQQRLKDEELLGSMPAWKRDVVLKKRRQSQHSRQKAEAERRPPVLAKWPKQ